jgi:hypothetical protein
MDIPKFMGIMWSSFEEFNVEQKLEAFDELKCSIEEDDLPQLLEMLASNKNDFWVRELLSEPICELGGSDCLPELFDALALNESEGHDSDSFCHFLTELAAAEPNRCKAQLKSLATAKNEKYKEYSEWLLEYCE